MVAANVLKLRGGGGGLLLSCRSRGGIGGGGGGPLLSSSCFSLSCYSRGVVGNWNGVGMLMVRGSLSLSPSISLHSKTASAPASRRVFAFHNVADSSSVTETSSSSSSSSSNVNDDPVMIKDAANTLDIRVGHILRAWRHAEADSLYVEEVDVGEPQPRLICSGLVKYIPLEHLQDKKVIVLSNLKPRNMRGIKSYGMLMAASDASHENVELLVPPEDSLLGERVWFGSADEKEDLPDAATPNQIQKKKIWELVQPHLKTDASCVAALGTHFMRTSAGVVICRSLKNANIS
uniref:Putative aminoacyl tRNA synthase complex-interacting multifunctional protein 1 n=1 Tax=Davidia involucrata TaxID=16924 RepID=A0A5B7BYY0_DAVIN